MSSTDLHARLETLVTDLVAAMGLSLDVEVHDLPDHVRVTLDGDDGTWLVRRKGEALDALQHVINTALRRDAEGDRRIVVDCLDFRTSKDRELRQMAKFLIEKVRSSGIPQELGPLNSYSRRLVHVEVAREPDVVSRSLGEGSVKRVLISRKEPDGRD
jgi:spoIIIJ-associated protein